MIADALQREAIEVREALPVQFKGRIGLRDATGAVRARAGERPSTLLYGPYWRLPAGRWRLRLRCAATGGSDRAPCLAVEVIADNRILQAARDFGPAACRRSDLLLDFAVTPELAETGQASKFEFRLLFLGGADVTVERVAIETVPDAGVPPPEPRWRLQSRLRPTLLARRRPDGAIASRASFAGGVMLAAPHPPLFLPAGAFALAPRFDLDAASPGRAPFARLAVLAGENELMRRDLARCDLDAEGRCALPFHVPEECGLESGDAAKIRFSLRPLGAGGVTLQSLDVEPRQGEAAPAAVRPAILRGAARVVIVGNCQADMLAQGFRAGFAFGGFRPKYHFARLGAAHFAQARRDLAGCDIVLAQAIGEWEDYPLREEIPPRVEIVPFPCLRLASPWPFDAYNGPTDAAAFAREGENIAFPYLDGRLGRLRTEFPDPEQRFAAYATLSPADLRFVERLARFETRRLETMDRDFPGDLGAFIEEGYRSRRLFHTTTHPGGALFARLMRWILRRIGRRGFWVPERRLDRLGDLQVPVHPQVARVLGIRWADARTLYDARGRRTDWESHVRGYIRHYG